MSDKSEAFLVFGLPLTIVSVSCFPVASSVSITVSEVPVVSAGVTFVFLVLFQQLRLQTFLQERLWFLLHQSLHLRRLLFLLYALYLPLPQPF